MIGTRLTRMIKKAATVGISYLRPLFNPLCSQDRLLRVDVTVRLGKHAHWSDRQGPA
jgi:hypothetical protein